jgi:hypothetical protein
MKLPVKQLAINHPPGLLDFLVGCNLFEVWVELFELQTFGVVLLVLGSNVTAGARYTGSFLLGTFQDHLNAIPFLCHFDFFEI